MALSDYINTIATAASQAAMAAEAIDKELLRLRGEADHFEELDAKVEKAKKELATAVAELAKAQEQKARIDGQVESLKKVLGG